MIINNGYREEYYFDFGALVALALLILIVSTVSIGIAKRNVQKEAVERGFATWEVDNLGYTNFVWGKSVTP